MSVNWTKEQMQVIESRGSNLLVSAAAGSGKTAVLVERIIRMVTEGEHPLDIDRLLVMTFTNAAAAEMRERIGVAIEQKLDERPQDEHLQMQAALVHHARITTIDSFCLDLIRNHFNLLDLDPAFRIGDEGELLLLRGDVMQELLEDYYRNGGERFVRFVETYARGKSDAGIEDIILQVYTFSQSNPYPQEWFLQCRQEFGNADGEIRREEEKTADKGEETGETTESKRWDLIENFAWMQFLITDIRRQAGELKQQICEALLVCREDEFLGVYAPMLEQDIRQLEEICLAENFMEIYTCLSAIAWARLASVRSKEVDPEKKALVTECRDRVKKAVTKMREMIGFAQPDEMLSELAATREPVEMLLELAEEFARRYQEKKRERNLVDFQDLEHEALKVLIRLEDGKMVYTEAADELSRQFEEVLVDEYQDSNLVQEALLLAVSQERFGRPNVFMVGDVKQSIYKFRLARPELFLKKYHTYEIYDQASGTNKKIELHQNFRSRDRVLAGINDVFFRVMTENLGNIRYTEETALHPGAVFPDIDDRGDQGKSEGEESQKELLASFPELLVMDTGAEALSGLDEEAADFTAKELEAKLIAGKIRSLTDPHKGLQIWDKKLNGTGGYRTAQYRDIVILLRSTAGWTENFLSVLMNEGIPACADSRMGYFATTEVEVVLSLLAVIDNPMQDIPLAAVLKSPVAGVTDPELARLMACYRRNAKKEQDRGIYAAVVCFMEEDRTFAEEEKIKEHNTDQELRKKLQHFLTLLRRFRTESTYLPIHELIYRVYEETGYYHYVSAMPAGETRRANLDMLVEKAADYEKTSYKGLFHFIRYIENLKRYHSDFGEASVIGEEDDTVRIMSIHKSKGLEFPVVFLAGMGKKFNKQDVYGRILIDPELGIATDYLDWEHRLKLTTLKKNALRRKMDLDNLGEELRVLYVAMTRAREQLIMTGTSRSLAKSLEKYAHVPLVDGQIPYTILSAAGSYLDWMLMSISDGIARVHLTEIPLAGVVGEELIRQVRNQNSRERLLQMNMEQEYQKEYREILVNHLNYQYPYETDIRLHTKMTVSELKKQGQTLEGEEESVMLIKPEEPSERELLDLEHFLENMSRKKGAGATRGTAYHRALELIPFAHIESREDIEQYLQEQIRQERLGKESLALINCEVIWRFLQSGLGRRMSLAEKEGRLYKEQQFVIGIPAREMGAGDSNELVVVQGIIDAYIEEEDGLVVVDYKTDRIYHSHLLVEQYKTQLDYYRRALAQMTGKPVKGAVIYSLAMQQEVWV
ncbi:MAG: helicase-exonuclease AddAB subunit AddA [Lachnospiraceae bacterium]|nr:helicase-exonuclease AddAB subunit AddA [Lachnospiraceae bacterium]